MPFPPAFAALALSALPLAEPAQTAAERALPPDQRAVLLALAKLASEHPELVSILPVGTSRQGRKIEALRLAAGENAPGRPALLIVANLEGPYAWTTGLALDTARELGARYESDAQVKTLLDTTTIYVIPCANPDAAEARFEKPLQERRATQPYLDDDRDGRVGEDGPSDVDGDGLVLTMRVPDPAGEWTLDPADARALVKADATRGERGTWKLWVEGRDSDRDEKVGEDPLLDVQVGRNFSRGWLEHAPEAGPWPTCEPESRALCDFVLAHRDVQLVLVYGAQDNLVEKPKTEADEGRGVLAATPESDGKLIAQLGKRYREATGSQAKSAGDAHGSFAVWCELERGLWCLSVNPWTLPLDTEAAKPGGAAADGAAKSEAASGKDEAAKSDASKTDAATTEGAKPESGKKSGAKDGDADKREVSDDTKRLRWVDANGESARFAPWKSFQHPELGAVEIGGFLPYALVEPPENTRAEIAAKQLAFVSSLGAVLARVRLVDVKAKDLGGVWRVEAVIQNDALLPLVSAAGKRTSAPRPARVTLRIPASARLLAGEKQTLVRELAGSGGRKELTWLVLGAAPTSIELDVDTDGAGTAHAIPAVAK